MIADCSKRLHNLQYKSNPRPNVNLAFSQTDGYDPSSVLSEPVCKDPQLCFKPFTFGGFISQTEGSETVPVQIMRDTGASHSIIVKRSVPFLNETYTGESVVMKGLGGTITVPLCRLYLK